MRSSCDIHLPDRCPILLLIDPVLGSIAVGAYTSVKLSSVAARDEAFRPVMIERASRQYAQASSRRADDRRATRVRIPHDAIAVGNEEIVSNKRHSEWRVELRKENGAHICNAVTVRIPQ